MEGQVRKLIFVSLSGVSLRGTHHATSFSALDFLTRCGGEKFFLYIYTSTRIYMCIIYSYKGKKVEERSVIYARSRKQICDMRILLWRKVFYIFMEYIGRFTIRVYIRSFAKFQQWVLYIFFYQNLADANIRINPVVEISFVWWMKKYTQFRIRKLSKHSGNSHFFSLCV